MVAHLLEFGATPADVGQDQAAVARLRALGATDDDVGQGDVPWVCLVDSEGNEFCVVTPG